MMTLVVFYGNHVANVRDLTQLFGIKVGMMEG